MDSKIFYYILLLFPVIYSNNQKEIIYKCFENFLIVCYAKTPLTDQTDDNFQEECLAGSNAIRARLGARPLRIDNKIVN